MGPMVFISMAVVIAIAAIAKTAGASVSRGGRGGAVPPSLPPSSASLPSNAPPEIAEALDSVRKGTATPEILSDAAAAASEAGLSSTAAALANSLDKLVNVTIPAIVKAPNRPGSPIPIDSASKKPLWKLENRNGTFSAIPMFKSVLVQFQGLQDVLGVDADGRIGPGTLAAFKKAASGYSKAPQSIDVLAANAVKWTEILKGKINSAEVGRPFDFASMPAPEGIEALPWAKFLETASEDISTLIPKVKEKFGSWVGKDIDYPTGENQAETSTITLSGLLGLVSKAGIRGAHKWLEVETDRHRYPHTTETFQSTNGLF